MKVLEASCAQVARLFRFCLFPSVSKSSRTFLLIRFQLALNIIKERRERKWSLQLHMQIRWQFHQSAEVGVVRKGVHWCSHSKGKVVLWELGHARAAYNAGKHTKASTNMHSKQALSPIHEIWYWRLRSCSFERARGSSGCAICAGNFKAKSCALSFSTLQALAKT